MKKIVVMLSMCMLINPLLSVHATTTHKKHHKKKHVHAVEKEYKEAAPAPATPTPAVSSWLDNLSGNFDFTSNYVFRGLSQTSNLPAAQGSLTYALPLGFYLNSWGSNVKFNDPQGRQATVELDTIAGIRNSIGNNFIAYDINLARYNYPGARGATYNEFNTLWTYKIFQLGISYSGNSFGYHDTGMYYNGTVTFNIPSQYAFHVQDLSLAGEFGHSSLSRAAGNSYNDYSVTLTKILNKTYTIAAQWTSTNGRQHNAPLDGSEINGTVTANF